MIYLKNILLLNAVSSGATGLGIIVLAPFIVSIFGIPQVASFYGTGIFLLFFAGFVLYESLQRPIRAGRVMIISTLDGLWVITSFAIVLMGLFKLSMIGYGIITGVALWVASMAYLQMKGIKQLAA